MTQRIAKTIRFETSSDNLLKILTDLTFQVDREKAQGAVDASVKVLSQVGDKLEYEVHTTEYAKGLTGIDKTKTEKGLCTYKWNLADMTASWLYVGPFGEKVKVWGNMKIIPQGQASELVSDFNVDIKIPLVGGKIEKVVAGEADKSWDNHDNLVRDYIARL